MATLSDLRAPTLSAVKWNFIGQGGRQALSFVVSVLLARLVAPAVGLSLLIALPGYRLQRLPWPGDPSLRSLAAERLGRNTR